MDVSTALIIFFTVLSTFAYYLRKQQEERDGGLKNSSMSLPIDQESVKEEEYGQGKDPSMSSPIEQGSVNKEEYVQRKDSSISSTMDQGPVHEDEYGQRKDSSSSPDNQCRCFSLAEIKLATNDFDDAFVIGKGGFGNVYKGKIDSGEGIEVAVKRLNLDTNQGATEFRAEIEMLSMFRHSHIVSLLGYHEGSGNKEMILVYEYMPNGSLEDHLHKNRTNGSNSIPLTWVQRLHICIGAARGLDYLHTGTGVQSRVIHRDVKSSNILLDRNLAAKISDFGLSRIGPANQSGTTNVYTDLIRGTFGYMDAEYFATHRLTRKSDVYAFGVVLLEVLCGRPALDFSVDEEQHSLAVWAKECIREGSIAQIIDPCLRGQIRANCLKEFGQIAYECILNRSKDRPTMTKVVARLESLLALASQKQGGVTIAEKMWSLFSIRTPAVHAKNHRSRQNWSNETRSKVGEGSSEGKENGVKLQEAAQGSNDIINKTVTIKEPMVTAEDVSGDYINEGGVINKLATKILTAQPKSNKMRIHKLKIFTYDELRRATRNFRPSAMVGVSNGASVYKGWVDRESLKPSSFGIGMAVLIRMSNTSSSSLDPKEWQAEVKQQGKFSHPNVVKLLGYCSEGKMRLLVHEYITNTNTVGRNPLRQGSNMKIAIGVSRGLAFLHAHESTHIFRTFNASNILVNENDEAQLYFGWTSLAQVRGSSPTSRYNPPEYMATGRWYVKSDVYAFGVMMLDMIAGLGFHYDNSSPESLIEWARSKLNDNINLEIILGRLIEEGNHLAELILSCLEIAPEKRPLMKEIVASLEAVNDIEM